MTSLAAADSDWVHCKYWNGAGVDVCIMYTLCLKKKIKPKTLVPVSFSYSVWQPRYGLWCTSVGGITWSTLKSDLIYFRLPAPDGSAMASRDTYFQITDADSFITCVQMATRAPSCINYSWIVRMNMKNNLSLRKRAVPQKKSQPGHHYIRQPADASLLGTQL
jgi:hypothetical protein